MTRRQTLIFISILSSGLGLHAQDASVVVPAAYASTAPINYVRSWNVLAPISDTSAIAGSSLNAVRQVTVYVDGLGRPIQTVEKQGSYPTGGSALDLVTAQVYDNMGRTARSYLPFAANTTGSNSSVSDGLFKLNPFQQQQWFYSDNNSQSPINGQGETFYYGKTEFENTPQGRPLKSLAPGDSWVNQGRGVETKYWLNTATDSVRIWTVTDVTEAMGSYSTTAMYGVGQLYKMVMIDEKGQKTIQFKDKDGQVVLKKVQLTGNDTGTGSGHSGWACTYYIYDDYNQLRAVVQPEGVKALLANSWTMSSTILGEQCFRYEYDTRGNMIRKKVPGAREVWMVYDVLDRPILVQDSNLRVQNKWLATLYDKFNRPVLTGLMGWWQGTRSDVQDAANQLSATPWMLNTSLTSDLLINTGSQSGTKQAMRSITLEDGFETTTGGEFTAEIVSGPGGPDGETSVIDGVEVHKDPVPGWAYLEVLTQTFYDDYTWRASYSNVLTDTRNSSYDSHLLSGSTSFPYPVTVSQSTMTRGLVTGTRIKVLGSSNTYLYTANFYDDKGRMIQTQSTNHTGGTDVTTTQYSFAGQPLVSISKQEKAGGQSQTTVMVTKTSYDDLWRPIKVEKKLSNTNVNSGSMSSYKTEAELEYDALGQLRKKKLGNKSEGGELAKLDYAYNIRGWLLSINKGYITGSNSDQYFGMELGYDKNPSLGSFSHEYNGNISGIVWKAEGDQEKRKYDFSYDGLNRLTAADFNQYASGSGSSATFNKAAGIDFSVSNLAYDQNGNILSQIQKGWKVTGSATIDDLAYHYISGSNKLLNVIDASNDAATKLGDFRTSTLHPYSGSKTSSTTDYTYDGNGNLLKDLNKDIVTSAGGDGIVYNYLNLPQLITVKGTSGNKGTIEYVYDAAGLKLKKIVKEGIYVQITDYLGGAVYRNDTLELMCTANGRIRYKPGNGSLQYDYFLKDHLGNIRTVLTEEQQTDYYPATTLEGSQSSGATSMVNWEKQFYSIDNNKITATSSITGWSSGLDYPNNNGNPPYNAISSGSYPSGYTVNEGSISTNMYKTNANSNKTALGFVAKVMAGDVINIFGKSYYYAPSTTFDNSNATTMAVSDIFNNLLAVAGNPATAQGISESNLETLNSSGYALPGNLIRGADNTSNASPKAYINYIILDNQLRYVTSGFSRVGSSGAVKSHWSDASMQNISVPKNGYIYVYVSNESNQDVFFDNLQVVHKRGPILEESHYYPFGLTMAGISSKAAGALLNRYKFNEGSELENGEFSDGSGIELYASAFRGYDAQIGRFWQMDPLSEAADGWSPYSFVLNNPISYNDGLGLTDSVTAGGEHVLANVTHEEVVVTTKAKAGAAANPLQGFVGGPTLPTLLPPSTPVATPAPGPSIPAPVPLIAGGVLLRVGGTIIGSLIPLRAGSAGEYPNGEDDYYIKHPHHKAPYVGHGNNKANTNDHIVYEFTFMPWDLGTPVLKYGISDVYRYDMSRPESQMADFLRRYGPTVTLRILARTNTRQEALDKEKELVDKHWEQWGAMPREQIRPRATGL